MAKKAVVLIFVFVLHFFCLASAQYCNFSSDCYEPTESCCSDGLCIAGSQCDSSLFSTLTWKQKMDVYLIVVFLIGVIACVLGLCCWAHCPYCLSSSISPKDRAGYQQLESPSTAHTTIQDPLCSGHNSPLAEYNPPPAGDNPRPIGDPWTHSEGKKLASHTSPQAQALQSQFPASTRQTDELDFV